MRAELRVGSIITIDGATVECTSFSYNTQQDVPKFAFFEEWPDHPTGFILISGAEGQPLVGSDPLKDNVASIEFQVTSQRENLSGFSMLMSAAIPKSGTGALFLDANMTNPPDFTFAQSLSLVASSDEVLNGPNKLADEIVFTPQDTGIPKAQRAITVNFSVTVMKGTQGQIDSAGISHVSPSRPAEVIEGARFQAVDKPGSMGVAVGVEYRNCFWPKLEAPVELFAPGSKGLTVEGPPTPRNVVFPSDTVFIGFTRDECFFVREEQGGQVYVATVTPATAAEITSGAKTVKQVKDASTFVAVESSFDDPELRVYQLLGGVMTDVTP